eukprot:gnl/TRDRNA2_/TRDRNA2_68675_c0_seq1.p1 gnl/TRDRNA2_/TRDRNA2_68675_c0~~gnl/TRDRNA2_/TRDRNA2_68675_c0_seq1.p1  ORF type:complete len:502 (+),score=69.59 gnl/TRDRNA2_/TRDRNA2_68675_c0_seq1:40-1545(+)
MQPSLFYVAVLGLLYLRAADTSRFAVQQEAPKARAETPVIAPTYDVPHMQLMEVLHSVPAAVGLKDSNENGTSSVVFAVARDCALFGGLVSTSVSPKCCYSTNILAQRTLHDFGMAQKCKPAWDCGKDGFVPTAQFEQNALREMCGEPSCITATVAAMDANWMTKQGSAQFASLCDNLMQGSGNVLELHRSNLRRDIDLGKHKTHWKDKECVDCRTKAMTALKAKGATNSKMYKNLKSRSYEKFCAKDPPEFEGDTGHPQNKDHECYNACCVGPGASCFPGQSQVTSRRGQMDLAEVEIGEELLVEVSPGQLEFAPLLSFLHRLDADPDQSYMEVVHTGGIFRASDTHLVFTCGTGGRKKMERIDKFVGNLQPGELLCGVEGTDVIPSKILHVERRRGDTLGMIAPLTAAGTVVVDGVVASNYASPSRSVLLKHTLAHMTLFPLRIYYVFGWDRLLTPVWSVVCQLLGWQKACADNGDLELHPFASLLTDSLHLERLVSIW